MQIVHLVHAHCSLESRVVHLTMSLGPHLQVAEADITRDRLLHSATAPTLLQGYIPVSSKPWDLPVHATDQHISMRIPILWVLGTPQLHLYFVQRKHWAIRAMS